MVLILMAQTTTTSEVLSTHRTISVLESLAPKLCMGLTSLCPDQCGHSGLMATFAVQQYTEYQKLGEYGDDRSSHFYLLLSDPAVPEAVRRVAATLTVGQTVRLDWNHIYTSRQEAGGGESKYPERPVLALALEG